MFLSRLGHYILLITKGFLRIESIYYGFFNDDTLEDDRSTVGRQVTSSLTKICCGILGFLSWTSSLYSSVPKDVLRGFEMTAFLFLESFALGSLDKYEFVDGCFVINDSLFREVMALLKVESSFDQFFDMISQRMLNDIEYTDIVLAKHTIIVVKNIVDRLKKIFRQRAERCGILEHFADKFT